MNLSINNSAKMTEIVFEKRNKNYGAYLIRQDYDSTLLKSLFTVLGLMLILFGSSYLYNKTHRYEDTVKAIILDDPKLDPVIYETAIDMTPLKEVIPNKQEAAIAPKNVIGTIIKDDVKKNTELVNIENSVSGNGSDNAKGNSVDGSETSTITTVSTETITSTTPNTEFIVVEDMPEFEGGTKGLMMYFSRNIVYPTVAREIGQEGTVYVSFVVNENGNAENPKIIKGIGYGCDEEVIRVIQKMPRWKKVGKQNGKAVKVRFNIPVSFKLK
jgi:protein TonB